MKTKIEGLSLVNVDSSIELRNLTIYMILVGVIHILGGYFIYQFISYPGSLHIESGTLMMLFGLLTLLSCLTVWQKKPWATKVIAGVGVVIFVPFIMFAFYFLAPISALLYALKFDHTRINPVTNPTDN